MKPSLLVFLTIFSCMIFSCNSQAINIRPVPKCPNGWTSYNNHCYKIFQNQLSSFDAQVACSSMNAYLTVINDQNEFNFINNNFLNTIRIAPVTLIAPRQFTSPDVIQ
jgi:hypothetical protein